MKKKQLSLFEEEIYQEMEQKGIVIVPKAKKALTKSQERFNKITERIEKLEKQLITKEASLHNILTYFSKNVEPLFAAEAKHKIKVAFAVEEKLLETKLSKNSKDQAKELIYTLLDDAFSKIVPNKEEEELFNRYSELDYQDVKIEQIIDMKSEMELMFAMQGIKIDLNDVDIEDEAEVAKLMRELQEKLKEKQEKEAENQPKEEKKKSKKQLEKELLEKAKEEVQAKSIKSIYISLSKALHPDTETDPTLKSEKEELMKKVTVAYQEKNFPMLLQLEMEWVHQTSEHLSELSDDKLAVYIEILLERENELKSEKYWLERNPKFEKIHPFAHLIEKSALTSIDKQKKLLKENETSFNTILKALNEKNNKKDITSIIDQLYYNFVGSNDYYWD